MSDEAISHRLILQDGNVISTHYQDAQAIVDRNKAGQADPHRPDYGRPVAEIPLAIVMQWLNEEHAKGNTGLKYPSKEFTALMCRKVKDRDWLWLQSQPSAPQIIGWGR